jgi:hypothetical protein
LIDVGVSINDRTAMQVGKEMNVFLRNDWTTNEDYIA